MHKARYINSLINTAERLSGLRNRIIPKVRKTGPQDLRDWTNNPDPLLRKIPIIGLNIVHDFSSADGHTWFGGTVYDPKNGNAYRGKMALLSESTESEGFVGIPLFDRTTTWTR